MGINHDKLKRPIIQIKLNIIRITSMIPTIQSARNEVEHLPKVLILNFTKIMSIDPSAKDCWKRYACLLD